MNVIQDSCTEPVLNGVELFAAGLAKAGMVVEATYGPSGGNVMVAGGFGRKVFDDGLKAIESLIPSDDLDREAAFYLRDAAKAQHDLCGDGTSTTMLLTVALVEAGLRLRKKYSAKEVSDRFRELLEAGVDSLTEMAREVKSEAMVVKAATLAMHGNEEWGKIVGELVWKMGKDGAVTLAASKGNKVEGVITDGVVWPGGVMDVSLLRGQEKMEMGESLVFMLNDAAENIETLWWGNGSHGHHGIIDQWQKVCAIEGKQLGLLLVCPHAGGSVLSTFAGNQRFGIVKTPKGLNSTLFFEDLKGLIGGVVYDPLRGNLPDHFHRDGFGRIPGITATRQFACITGGDEGIVTAAKAQADLLESVYGEITLKDDYGAQSEKRTRLAMLSGGVGEVRFPVSSQVSVSATMEILEDGIRAAKESLDGVLPGGGNGLRTLSLGLPKGDIEDEWSDALDSVAVKASNSGRIGWVVADSRTGAVGDAEELGILDPLNVVVNALRNATAVTIPIINTNLILVQKDEVKVVQ